MPGDVADARHTVAARVAAQRAHARDGSDAGDARDDAVGCWGCLRCTRWRARGRRASAARAANRLRRRPQRRALFLLVLFPSFPSSFLPFFRSFFLFLAASCFRYRPITARVETRHSGRSTVSFVHWFFFNTKKCSPSCTESKGWPRFLPWLPGFYRVFLGAFMFPANPKVESKRLPGFYGFLVVTGFFSTGFLARRFRVLCTSQSLASIRFPPITLPSFSLLGFWSALIHSFADWLIRSERTAKRTRTR